MANIVNFEEEIKRKSADRESNVLFNLLNRFLDAKNTGALEETEFAKLLVITLDIFANKVKQGKVSKEDIENVETYITSFIGPNKDNYFSLKHKEMDKAAKMGLEGIFVAEQELNNRNIMARPVDNYSKGYRKAS